MGLSPRHRRIATLRLALLVLALALAVGLLYHFFIAVPAAPPPAVTRAAAPVTFSAQV